MSSKDSQPADYNPKMKATASDKKISDGSQAAASSFKSVKVALHTSSIPIDKHQQPVQGMLALLQGSSKGLSGNSLQGHQKNGFPLSQYPGTLMGETSIEQQTEVQRYKQSNSSRKLSMTQAKVSWTIIEDIH